ncbi:MAG: rubrerythrin [Planctomycetia bacterium]|nr:rubrerythrin [Planctomycetia bacterium]NCF98603.1 rubrerythrin [Planctomycetia bacterium]NCG56903.1 rubrerythrin [Pseudomonadota bacterium]
MMNEELIEELTKSYWMEIETTISYIAASTNLVGVQAEPIKQSLAADVLEEIQHAQILAKRIHIIGGVIPGSMSFSAGQLTMQPTEESTDVVSVIKGVIDTEVAAINQYKKIIKLCEDDPVTEDICVTLLADEEEHLRSFQGYLYEFENR